LRAWLRVIGLREASHLSERREVASDDDLVFDRAVGIDHELLRAKEGYRKMFREAFQVAVGSLSFHDRLLLRQHFCDELSLDELARLHRMHRATAARQLAKIRDKLLEKTRAHFATELAIESDDFAQLMALIASQLDASLGRMLR
jgi:RNA polymerase sigma-70 factor (ECF subfamily)